MYKRLVLTVISVIVLAFSFPAAAFASHDDDGVTSGRSRIDDTTIWEGLCVGASLDLSRASRAKCAHQAREAERNREEAREPNIQAGLCTGASLNISDASWESCERQVSEGQHDRDHDHDYDHDKNGHDRDGNRDKDHHDGYDGKDGQKTSSTPPPPEPQDGSTTPERVEYAALGDSVAAGQGLAELSGRINARCDRSFQAYAFDVAETFGLEPSLIACSGATLGDLFTEQGVSGPNLDPQLDIAFAGGTPELITITAGANDVQWDDFLRKCYASTCGTTVDEGAITALMTALEVKMQVLFSEIAQRSNGEPPRVILTGYYNPLSAECADIEPRLGLDEIAWLGAQTESLNHTLYNAASQHDFVRFAPLDFTGHDVCSDEPWVQGLDDRAPSHPTVEGQQAIAQQIV